MKVLKHLTLFLHLLLLSIISTAQAVENCGGSCGHRSIASTTNANFFQDNKMNLYDLEYMKLDLNVQPVSRAISGSCTYRAIVKASLDTFIIELKQNMVVDSILVNATNRTFTRRNDHIYIPLAAAATMGTALNISFFYRGTASSAALFVGTVAGTGLQYAATVSESFQAREWFPAKQLLNDKIDSCDLWFTTDAAYKVGSNGVLKEVVSNGTRRQYRWATRYPINYYLPSFSVGNYLDYRNYAKPAALPNDSVLNQHYIVDNVNYFNNVKVNLDKTPRFLETFSDLFTLYPFYKEKYGHAQAGIGGGMEHQTMSTMDNFGTSLIAHELAHQWWGDNVTCATWNDIWLNEGFASYSEYLGIEYLPALFPTTNTTAKMLGVHNNVMSAVGGSVYVPVADSYNEGRIFSGRLSYDKGSAIVHNLRFEMQSDTLFFKTLRTFQQRYKNTFAITTNFRQVAEEVAGRSFVDFFNQWYFGEGYPTYNVAYGKQGNSLVINLSQTTSMPSSISFFKGLIQLRIRSAQGDTIIVLNHTADNQQFTIPYTKTPSGVDVDPNNWIINKVGNIVTAINTIPASQAGIRIFPNPTKGQINITFPSSDYKTIRVVDIAGRIVGNYVVQNGSTLFRINLAVSRGVYFIHLNGAKGNVVERIIVQ